MQRSDIPTEIQIVKVVFMEESYNGRVTDSTLKFMYEDSQINQLRKDHYADLVAMITTDTPNVCGIAYFNSWVSATAVDCLRSYTFEHELGHNFGGKFKYDHCINFVELLTLAQ